MPVPVVVGFVEADLEEVDIVLDPLEVTVDPEALVIELEELLPEATAAAELADELEGAAAEDTVEQTGADGTVTPFAEQSCWANPMDAC